MRLRVIKSVGDMKVFVSYGRVPNRFVPPFTVMPIDTHIHEETFCNVDRFLKGASGQIARYYFGLYGGRFCSTYEIVVTPFTGQCNSSTPDVRSIANRLSSAAGSEELSEEHGAAIGPGQSSEWECYRNSARCQLTLDHHLYGSCRPYERVPPLVLTLPYGPSKTMDNLVFEVSCYPGHRANATTHQPNRL
jgi:hypothetical protein